MEAFADALSDYAKALDQLVADMREDAADGDPIFSDRLEQQRTLFRSQEILARRKEQCTAVLTKYGFADQKTAEYRCWTAARSGDCHLNSLRRRGDRSH